MDGLIYGFVSKDQARDLLREHVGRLKKPESAMLVRYSEKQEGAVCVVRFTPNSNGGVVEVVEPWDRAELKKQNLFQKLLLKSTFQKAPPTRDDYSAEAVAERRKVIQLILTYPREKPLYGPVNAKEGPVIPEMRPSAETLKAMQPKNSALSSTEETVVPDDYEPDKPTPGLVQVVNLMELIRIGEQG